MTTRVWSGQFPGDVGAGSWSPYGAPVAGDTAVINGKTIDLGGIFPINLTIQINAGPLATNGAELNVGDAEFGVGDRISLTASSRGSVKLETTGPVTNYGLIGFHEAAADGAGVPTGTLDIGHFSDKAPDFVNASAIELAARDVTIIGAGTFANNGSIILTHPGNDASTYSLGDFELAVQGTGTIHVRSGTEADFNAPVGANQLVAFEPGPLASPTVLVERPTSFAGSFARFTVGSRILLATPLYDGTQVSAANGVTRLTFTSAGTTVAALSFIGSYTSDQLVISPTNQGTLDVVTITTTAQTVANAGAPPNDIPAFPVFRFFDTRLGTHFFTADPNEYGHVRMSRPDLTFEGVGLHAANPVADDPNAIPVYRFFDSVDGTHFFTASESEKAMVINTRPDLIFEPSSTFSEHQAAEPTDVAVYRYFDSVHGTQFLTASASEQAAITATRPDLIAEGIAFYAPTS